MPKKFHEDHILKLWSCLSEAARLKNMADVLFYASRLVDNLGLQPGLPTIHLEEVEPTAPDASGQGPSIPLL